MSDNSYIEMYKQAILANRELGGKDQDVPQPFQLSALEKFHFNVVTELRNKHAAEAEKAAHDKGAARKATFKED